jgi:hypothetical protein
MLCLGHLGEMTLEVVGQWRQVLVLKSNISRDGGPALERRVRFPALPFAATCKFPDSLSQR